MSHQVSLLVLLGCCLMAATLVQAGVSQEKPRSTAQLLKARRSSYFNEPALAKFRSNDADLAVALDQKADQDKLTLGGGAAGAQGSSSTGTKDASSGRLFLKKFLMFKNMFSSSSQPVIPIIITGAGTGTTTGTTNPTTTVTSTGTIPTATGTVTTSPATGTTGTGTATSRQGDALAYGADVEEDDQADADEPQAQAYPGALAANADMLDEQALEAALAAGAQEYEVVTEPEVQGTGGATESKASQNNLINLRRKGARRGQQISVRIPPRYRRYFKNGQKVMLNANRRPNKRRVVRKRVQNKKLQNRRRVNGGGNKNINNNRNKNRNRNKGNKRTRITAV